MYPDMLLLAERLVIAMETMSQDVKNMSTYMYDMSQTVSCLLNDKKEKERISVAASDDVVEPRATSAAGQETSAESECTGQYVQMYERSSSHIGVSENGGSYFEATPSLSIESHKYSDVLSSDDIPIFTDPIKIEEQAEVGVRDEPSDLHNVYGDSRNNVRNLKEMKSETQLETEKEDQEYRLQTTISQSEEQLTDSITFVSRLPEGQTPGARTCQMESAKDPLVVDMCMSSENRPYKCSVCLWPCKSRSDLQRHSRVHSGERPYKCNVCGKAFTLSGNLTKHMRCHTNESLREGQTSRARTCQMEIAKEPLVVHMSMNSKDRPYKCSVCLRSCKSRCDLQRHSRVHSGERPYKCNVCGKAFTLSGNLTKHMRCHTNERPFRCNICGKAYIQKSNLMSHMHSHTDKSSHMLCGKKFHHRTCVQTQRSQLRLQTIKIEQDS